MRFKLTIYILLTIFIQPISKAQTDTYTITKTPFSSAKSNEFSPVYYDQGLVYCTNGISNVVSNYSSSQGSSLFKITYIENVGKDKWSREVLLSKDLTTILNDGPATFSRGGDTVYFSRNLVVEGKLSELSSARNKLGIFYAVKEGKGWTGIREFRFNSEWYNNTTPALSPDGKRLFFASDKPGGYGGADLYYCEWKGDYWDNPVNLGQVINTEGNESYPFVNQAGELFFASDGHPGIGGKDIYITKENSGIWIKPIRLDEPLNSRFDDFGLITDELMEDGYFSSNRDESIDIFHFKSNYPQIFYSNIQKKNQYCFRFDDSGSIVIDTSFLQYRWSFGDGKSVTGAIVEHCFPGPGTFNVNLDIVERGTGRLFFTKQSYWLELSDYEQPFINSPDVVVRGDIVELDGLKSYLPGFEIQSYAWDFGDGSRSIGERVTYSFTKAGEFTVNLGLVLKSLSTGNIHKAGISKKITVVNDLDAKESYMSARVTLQEKIPDIREYENAEIRSQFSAEKDIKTESVFVVEVLSSKTKVGINSNIFRNIPVKYTLKERFYPEDSTYSYTIEQHMNLMATYYAYSEIQGLGFKNARTRLLVIKDPGEKELYNLIRTYGAFADSYFDSSNRLTSNAYIMLDQFVKLMNKYPSKKLEIAVHSDNSGTEANNFVLSQRKAQILVNYLINKGIHPSRLIATGFGESKPIAPNFLERDRKLNRRIDFILVN